MIDYHAVKLNSKPGVLGSEDYLFYARPVAAQRIDIEALAREISYSTTLTDVEVEGVIKALVKQMQLHIDSGHIVSLGKFGSFRVTFNSMGVPTEKEVSSKHIKKVNLRFCPGTGLRDTLSIRNLKFRRMDAMPSDITGEEVEPGV